MAGRALTGAGRRFGEEGGVLGYGTAPASGLQSAQFREIELLSGAKRQIGTRSGTGGSTGGAYPRDRVALRYFPLLWGLRAWP
jgi:tryptophan 2,3-dioxygenase